MGGLWLHGWAMGCPRGQVGTRGAGKGVLSTFIAHWAGSRGDLAGMGASASHRRHRRVGKPNPICAAVSWSLVLKLPGEKKGQLQKKIPFFFLIINFLIIQLLWQQLSLCCHLCPEDCPQPSGIKPCFPSPLLRQQRGFLTFIPREGTKAALPATCSTLPVMHSPGFNF